MTTMNLKKNKSVKYYLNQLPMDIIEIINNKIPVEKKYKDKIKNKQKINKIIKNMEKYYEIKISGKLYSNDEQEVQFARDNIINYHNNNNHFIDINLVYKYKNNRTKIKESLCEIFSIKNKLLVTNNINGPIWLSQHGFY